MKCLTLIIRSNKQEVSNNCLSLQVVYDKKERSMNMDNYMELDAMKAALAREILNTDSSEILNKVRKVFERSKKEVSVANEKETIEKEEVLSQIRKSMLEVKEARKRGNKLQTLEELIDELHD